MIQRTKFDNFFIDKAILTCYNGLGITKKAHNFYVNTTIQKLAQSSQCCSQYIKQDCYQLFYPEIKRRKKRTGFEEYADLEKTVKKQFQSSRIDNVFNDKAVYSLNETKDCTPENFKEEISKFYSNYNDNIILYLSGGVDSELLANIFIENGISFKPVLFEWIDDKGNVTNNYEAKFAYNFCHLHQINLEVIQINIPTLWKSDDFYNLFSDTGFSSLHTNMHAYMVFYLEKIFPHSLHVFGGEVRYTLDRKNEDIFLYATKCVNETRFATIGGGTPAPNFSPQFIEGGIGYFSDFPNLQNTVFLYIGGGNNLTNRINRYYNQLENRDGEIAGMNFWYEEYYRITQDQGIPFDPNSLNTSASSELRSRMANTAKASFDVSDDKCTLRSQGWNI